MASLRDPSLRSCLFFADLVASIWPAAVDWSKVSQGMVAEDRLSNAKYVLAIVRSIGILVFLSAEDLVVGGVKMLLGFFASLWEAELRLKTASEALGADGGRAGHAADVSGEGEDVSFDGGGGDGDEG
jgi:hypothetical protein